MINDKELKFLQQTADSLVKAIGWEDKDSDNSVAYEQVLNALINKYIDTVKNED